MRLDGQELERELLTPYLKISERMTVLNSKHKAEIEKTGKDPVFCIEGTQSSINKFNNLLAGHKVSDNQDFKE
jgi:hypothetical protein